MTVIITDGHAMAGDGRVTAGDSILADDFVKVRHLDDGSVCGMAGDLRDCFLAWDWLDRGAPFDAIPRFGGKPNDKHGFEAVILRPDGRIEYFDVMCVFIPYTAPFAIGCASDVALACLDAGMSLEDSVRLAARRNTKCGGQVTRLAPFIPPTERKPGWLRRK